MGRLTRETILHALNELARRLPQDRQQSLLVVGGAALVQGLALGERLLSTPSLVVHTTAPAQLLAMKLSAWRDDVDIADSRLLLSKVQGDREAVWRQVEPHLVPGRGLKASYAFADLWEAAHGTR